MCHLLCIAVEQQRVAPSKFADASFCCLAPARVIDLGVHVRVEAVLVRRGVVPRRARLGLDEAQRTVGLGAGLAERVHGLEDRREHIGRVAAGLHQPVPQRAVHLGERTAGQRGQILRDQQAQVGGSERVPTLAEPEGPPGGRTRTTWDIWTGCSEQ